MLYVCVNRRHHIINQAKSLAKLYVMFVYCLWYHIKLAPRTMQQRRSDECSPLDRVTLQRAVHRQVQRYLSTSWLGEYGGITHSPGRFSTSLQNRKLEGLRRRPSKGRRRG